MNWLLRWIKPREEEKYAPSPATLANWDEGWKILRKRQEPAYSAWVEKYGKESADAAFGRNEADPYA